MPAMALCGVLLYRKDLLEKYGFAAPPVTWEELENVCVELATNANPVMAVAEIGLTPRSPVIAEVGTFVIPDFDRTTKLAALPRLTGARVEAACAITQVRG